MQFGVNIPFVKHLGFDLQRFENGQSEIHFDPRPEHLNSFGVVHGGVCMTLLDVAMSAAARSMDSERGVVTIEMKTSFMRASRGKLNGKARVMHRTATLAFTEATVLDADGKPCAHATGTFKYVKRLPTGPKSANSPDGISTD